MNATAVEPLELCGVRPGMPCWLVRRCECGPPLHCPAAVLVRFAGEVCVLFDSRLYDFSEVFPCEKAAREKAVESARWYVNYYRSQLTRAEQTLSELGAD